MMVDTNVFIRFEKSGGTLELPLGQQPEPVYASVLTLSELLMGVHRANTPERRRRRAEFVEAIVEGVGVLDFTLGSATIHAEIYGELAKSGQMIGSRSHHCGDRPPLRLAPSYGQHCRVRPSAGGSRNSFRRVRLLELSQSSGFAAGIQLIQRARFQLQELHKLRRGQAKLLGGGGGVPIAGGQPVEGFGEQSGKIFMLAADRQLPAADAGSPQVAGGIVSPRERVRTDRARLMRSRCTAAWRFKS